MSFREDLLSKRLIFDGAMGTALLLYDAKPETANTEHSDVVVQIHKDYIKAGATVISTNSFWITNLRINSQKDFSIKKEVEQACNLAKLARSSYPKVKILFDVGPMGQLVEPNGKIGFEQAVNNYAKVFMHIPDRAVDGILIETQCDIAEAKAAIIAAKETQPDLPILVSFTYEGKRTLTGSTPEIVAAVMDSLGVAALGVNCLTKEKQLWSIGKAYRSYARCPSFVQPNAGSPQDPWLSSPEKFASLCSKLSAVGFTSFGGCCGTTTEHIRALQREIVALPSRIYPQCVSTTIASPTNLVDFSNPPILIGESLNTHGSKRFRTALEDGDLDTIVGMAISQEEAGAHVLDLHVALGDKTNESEVLDKVSSRLSSVCNLPLCLDISSPTSLESALRHYPGKPLINSVTATEDSMAAVFPLVKKYGGTVIILPISEQGVAKTVEEKLNLFGRILQVAYAYRIDHRQLIFDPMACALGAYKEEDYKGALGIKEVSWLSNNLDMPSVMGLSNLSMGLPNRSALNASAWLMYTSAGLTASIVNVTDARFRETYACYRALSLRDKFCKDFLESVPLHTGEIIVVDGLPNHIVKGNKSGALKALEDELRKDTPERVLNNIVMPTLDYIGLGYSKGTIFLPQLISASEVAKAVVSRLMKDLPASSANHKLRVILATVEGDVHDIGKSIVKSVVEANGFVVDDLGVSVAPSDILAAISAVDAPVVVGLSALMTTSIKSMQSTVEDIRRFNADIPIYVGGAVIDDKTAKKVGATAWSKDPVGFVQQLKEEEKKL